MTSFLRPYTTRVDNSFDKKRIKDYIITIQCSLDGFSYSVFDETIATFIVLEHYNIIKQDAGIEQVIDEFQERKNIELPDNAATAGALRKVAPYVKVEEA